MTKLFYVIYNIHMCVYKVNKWNHLQNILERNEAENNSHIIYQIANLLDEYICMFYLIFKHLINIFLPY